MTTKYVVIMCTFFSFILLDKPLDASSLEVLRALKQQRIFINALSDLAETPRDSELYSVALKIYKRAKKETKISLSDQTKSVLMKVLNRAIVMGSDQIAHVLLRTQNIRVSDAFQTDELKRNVLHIALDKMDLPLLIRLVKTTDVVELERALSLKDSHGRTPLDCFSEILGWIAQEKDFNYLSLKDLFEAMTEKGFPIKTIPYDVRAQAIELASFVGNKDYVEFLLENHLCEADMIFTKGLCTTPLHVALMQKRVEVLKSLLRYSTQSSLSRALNYKDLKGNRPEFYLLTKSEEFGSEILDLYERICCKSRRVFRNLNKASGTSSHLRVCLNIKKINAGNIRKISDQGSYEEEGTPVTPRVKDFFSRGSVNYTSPLRVEVF